MHIKNTIPAEFVFNSALMKNIENTPHEAAQHDQ